MKPPLLQVTVLFVGGILAASYLPLPLGWLLALGLCLVLLALAWGKARGILLGALLFVAGASDLTLHTAVLSPNDLRRLCGTEPSLVTVRGRLAETPTWRVYGQGQEQEPVWRTVASLDVIALCPDKQDWRPAEGRMAVSTRGQLTNVFAGQTVEISGVAALPRTAAAEGMFDYRAHLRRQGVYYVLQAPAEADWRIIDSPAAPVADRFRTWARAALARGLPVEDESLRLEWALTLGWKTAMTDEVSEPFVQAATYHIFAVDGLRMAIIFGIFFCLFRALQLTRGVCGLLLVPLIWFYVALTGWPASAIRATVMLTIVIFGWVLRRPTNLINSLLAAAFLILAWEPLQLFQAGFQLSFLVVLFLILLLPPLHALSERLTAPDPFLPPHLRRRWPPFLAVPARYLADIWWTSLAAWIGSIPLVAYYFNILTPVSAPANLVAVPLCGLVLISNLASLLLSGWFPAGAEVFNHAGWFLMECIRVSSVWFAAWPKAYFYVPAPSLFTMALYYCLLLALLTGWLVKPAPRLWKFALCFLPIPVWCVVAWIHSGSMRLTVLPVEGGVAIFSSAGRPRFDLLIDGGNSNAVRSVTRPFLRAQGVNRLDGFLLTHGDARHIGGAEMVADLFAPRRICASHARTRSPPYRRALGRFGQVPGWTRALGRNETLGPWRVLHPDPEDRFTRADDNAVVLAGTIRGTRVLLLSDLGRAGQNALLERSPDLRADIVITGLSAGSEALCDALLEAIQPRLILVADSEFPASERAGARFRERLAAQNVPVVYTRVAGSATLEFHRGGWVLRTMSGLRCSGGP